MSGAPRINVAGETPCMKTVPERSTAAQVFVIIAGFLAGPIAAFQLTPVLSPGSTLVTAIAPFTFGLVFFFGLMFWIGLGVITLLGTFLFGAARGTDPIADLEPTDRIVPSGHTSFVVVGGFVGAGVGIIGAVASEASFLVSFCGWLALGLVYGIALSSAASQGYLPFPDDD